MQEFERSVFDVALVENLIAQRVIQSAGQWLGAEASGMWK
jgi:hypothetical protein